MKLSHLEKRLVFAKQKRLVKLAKIVFYLSLDWRATKKLIRGRDKDKDLDVQNVEAGITRKIFAFF